MSLPSPPPLPPVIGHRGARGHAPENTLAGLARARELGALWVEFDVKLTADGVPILMHDDTLKRTTDGRGDVAARSLAEIRALDAGRWFSASFAGEGVPTLDEAMAFLASRGMGANVEIKPCPGRAEETGAVVARALAARWMGMALPPFVSSFSAAALAAANRAAPDIPRGLVADRVPADWGAQLAELGCATFHLHERRITEDRVRAVRDAGYRMLAYTVNDAARARKLLDWGVESIITDYPERIAAR